MLLYGYFDFHVGKCLLLPNFFGDSHGRLSAAVRVLIQKEVGYVKAPCWGTTVDTRVLLWQHLNGVLWKIPWLYCRLSWFSIVVYSRPIPLYSPRTLETDSLTITRVTTLQRQFKIQTPHHSFQYILLALEILSYSFGCTRHIRKRLADVEERFVSGPLFQRRYIVALPSQLKKNHGITRLRQPDNKLQKQLQKSSFESLPLRQSEIPNSKPYCRGFTTPLPSPGMD